SLRDDAERAAPLVEQVEHVGVTEIDLHRPPPRALAVVTLEVPIDAGAGDLERHALLGPARHDLERRPDHANQMAVVLAAQIGLDLTAVSGGIHAVPVLHNGAADRLEPLRSIALPDDAQPVQRN